MRHFTAKGRENLSSESFWLIALLRSVMRLSECFAKLMRWPMLVFVIIIIIIIIIIVIIIIIIIIMVY